MPFPFRAGVATAWPTLSEPIRRAMLALVASMVSTADNA
jgi:hypothetical protein